MSKSVTCPKCGSSVEGGTGFGMVECAKCGEFIMLGEVPMDAIRNAAEFSAQPMEFTVAQAEPLLQEDPVKTTVLDLHSSDSGDPSEFVDSHARRPLAPPPLPPSAFADVVEFANQQQPSTGTGGLVYDIHISGIDTVESRKDLSACLDDKRLQIDLPQILNGVKEGELELPNLNPVKAVVILNHLRHLPFQISWKSKQLVKGAFIFFLLWICSASSNANASEWARHEVNLKGYATKIENMQEDLRGLITKKVATKDPKERDELMTDIIKKNAELRNAYKEFKAEKEHVRFEHPEQGDNTERKYHHVKLKSLDELENEVGLDGQLSRIKRKVKSSFPNAESLAKPSPHPSP